MKGIMARVVAAVVLGGLATGAAFGGPPDPEPGATQVQAPVPAPAPAPTPNQEKLEIFRLKITTEMAKLDAIKIQGSAKSQKEKDEVAVVMQMLDSIYSKLEDMLAAI